MKDNTGLVSRAEWEVWYHRMKDMLNPIQQRGYAIACNPADKAMMVDMLERLQEDDTWQHGEDVPALLVTDQIKRGEIRPADGETLKIITMAQVNNSRKGFGKFNGLLLPKRDGLHVPTWQRKNDGVQ